MIDHDSQNRCSRVLYQFSDWVNVFKPGTGSITIWENVGGQRGAQIYQLDHIPLTPGPLVVVIKVAASQVTNASGFWPPSLPDAIETIAASYGTPAPLLALWF